MEDILWQTIGAVVLLQLQLNIQQDLSYGIDVGTSVYVVCAVEHLWCGKVLGRPYLVWPSVGITKAEVDDTDVFVDVSHHDV